MDLVLIDGSHSFAYVESDTRNAMNMIRPGAVLLWDDYGSIRAEYGTSRYLEQMRRAGISVFRLGNEGSCARYRRAAMRVDDEIRKKFEEWTAVGEQLRA